MKKLIYTFLLILIMCIGLAINNNTFAIDETSNNAPNSQSTILPLIDINANGKAVIQFTPDDIRAKDVRFRVYKIANVTENYKIELTEPFKKYNISLDGIYNDEWKNIAGTLASYIEVDKINPTYTLKLNDLGLGYIDKIGVGIYLVLGDKYITEDYIYTPVPFLMSLPTYDEEKETFYYNVTAYVKYEKESEQDQGKEPEQDLECENETEKLPQTGVLWWPVPVCAICGIIIFLVGFIRYKGDENGERGDQEGQESNETDK